MKLNAFSYLSADLSQAKKIYLSGTIIRHECPECHEINEFDNCVPILTKRNDDSYYCHVVSCKECDFESDEKMYSINEIGNNYVDLKFNKELFNIKVFGMIEREITDE